MSCSGGQARALFVETPGRSRYSSWQFPHQGCARHGVEQLAQRTRYPVSPTTGVSRLVTLGVGLAVLHGLDLYPARVSYERFEVRRVGGEHCSVGFG